MSVPKIEDGLGNISWKEALDIIRNIFDYRHIKVEIVSQNEANLQLVNASIRKEEVEEGDVDNYTEEFAHEWHWRSWNRLCYRRKFLSTTRPAQNSLSNLDQKKKTMQW